MQDATEITLALEGEGHILDSEVFHSLNNKVVIRGDRVVITHSILDKKDPVLEDIKRIAAEEGTSMDEDKLKGTVSNTIPSGKVKITTNTKIKCEGSYKIIPSKDVRSMSCSCKPVRAEI